MAANCKSFLRFMWYYPLLVIGLILFYAYGVGSFEEPLSLTIVSCTMLLFISLVVFLYLTSNQFQMAITFSSTRKAAFGGMLAVQLLWWVCLPAVVLLVLWLLRGPEAVTFFWQIAPLELPLLLLAVAGGGLLGFATMLLRKAGRIVAYVLFVAVILGCFCIFISALSTAADRGSGLPIGVPLGLCGGAAACFVGEGIVASRYCVKG